MATRRTGALDVGVGVDAIDVVADADDVVDPGDVDVGAPPATVEVGDLDDVLPDALDVGLVVELHDARIASDTTNARVLIRPL